MNFYYPFYLSNVFITMVLLYQGSMSEKVRFMLFERGPWAFFDGSGQLIHDYVYLGTPGMHNLSSSASAHISERISVLTSLRYSLATFLAQVSYLLLLFLLSLPKKSLLS